MTLINADHSLSLDLPAKAVRNLASGFDNGWGGFGGAPKFPQPMVIEFLLREYLRSRRHHALDMAETTLQHMAQGGMYDQIGGGFARYSTDELWLAPHFEKMLYDNAQLARVYLHAWQTDRQAILSAGCGGDAGLRPARDAACRWRLLQQPGR